MCRRTTDFVVNRPECAAGDAPGARQPGDGDGQPVQVTCGMGFDPEREVVQTGAVEAGAEGTAPPRTRVNDRNAQ